ncbi:TcmI family type II polyketide cyclase, partial [Streptomyces caniscabiei]|uniref:TcmI family type II polyketide cyclase n=1 Tax=Streptomyces caniscabiei TaxID=2746961 RepID=UPI001F22A35B
ARMAPGAAPDIAKIFEESDRGELPHLIGVSRRSLFQFDDVYIHLVEAERDPTPVITKMAGHPEFRAISERLSAYVTAYDPAACRSHPCVIRARGSRTRADRRLPAVRRR